MKENLYVQYNSSNKDYARFNRKNQTKAEKIMRNEILRKRQTGYLFLRQKMLGSFIVDFYCSELLLAIEIDGNSHKNKQIYDINRTNLINDLGIFVIRYTNEDVFGDIELLKSDLIGKLDKRKQHVRLVHN